MKQSFSAFPAGLAGIGLLLLRLSLVLSTALGPPGGTLPLLAIPLYLLAISIGLGFLTRIAGGLCLAYCAYLLMNDAASILLVSRVLDAAALALIGPGAFSIDARLFGRRTIHLPG